MRKIILILLMVIGHLTGFAEEVITYEKVVSAPADWSGEYLIVYEASDEEAYILNSQLSTTNEFGNYGYSIASFTGTKGTLSYGNVQIHKTGGFTPSEFTTEDMLFTITKQKNEKYFILSRSNYYISRNAQSPGISVTAYSNSVNSLSIGNTISMDTNNNVFINFKFNDSYSHYLGFSPSRTCFRYSTTSNDEEITLYRKVTKYKRGNLTVGNYGTICLPCTVKAEERSGAIFYNIAGTMKDANGYITGIVLTEETGDLVAGKPYIFKATNTELSATYSGERTTVQNGNGLVGNLSEGTMYVPNGKYILSSNELHQIAEAATATVGTNRAYIDMESLSEYQGNVKGQVYFGLDGEIINDVSMIRENTNHLIYDLSGRIVTKPTSGLYIMNNKKIILK